MPNIPKVGPFYWKMNTALLELPDIEYKFKEEWGKIKSAKNRYTNINNWWDSHAKTQIKRFFYENWEGGEAKEIWVIESLGV